MNGKRDPRIDPVEGDILFKLGQRTHYERHVQGRDGGQVIYRTSPSGVDQRCWMDVWMDWARNADLGHVAPTPQSEEVPETPPEAQAPTPTPAAPGKAKRGRKRNRRKV